MSRTPRAGSQKNIPPAVEAVRQRIEHWRATREKRTHMPEHLWRAAAALARDHGLWFVSRALRVRYEGLKKRTGPPPAGERPTAHGFVEVAATDLIGGSNGPRAVIELSDGEGKMVVRLEGRDAPDVLALATGFWRRHG